jgi:plasmid stabilization system protein ParE
MAANLVFTPEVAEDLRAAYDWYECQRVGLGEEFLGCVDACIQAICREPEMHARVRGNYRRALVRRFPYAIFYEHSHGIVTVYCIFHTSRDSIRWRQRLP